MHPRAPVLVLFCALLLSACGGGSDVDPERAATTPRQDGRQAAPSVPGGSLEIPSQVPRQPSGDGDPAAIEVIRTWTDALRRSDIAGAAAQWAVPSKVQNGTPVLTLGSVGDVRLFNDALTCGSRLTSARGASNGFTVVVLELTNRPGADCGTGVGSTARTAILVRDGKIAEWYRLPDDPDAPEPGTPRAPDQPELPVI